MAAGYRRPHSPLTPAAARRGAAGTASGMENAALRGKQGHRHLNGDDKYGLHLDRDFLAALEDLQVVVRAHSISAEKGAFHKVVKSPEGRRNRNTPTGFGARGALATSAPRR